MIQPPEYFERIRQNAIKRWEQLEGDPEIAAPTHQLFKQVQSPRHVISELLQNADDAGATKASARIEDEDFIFEHNGEDFTEEQFESLCRFGYSNKRILHTIGFRGIGFKSTFSLGEKVSIYTPTLALYFHKDRFTEPVWTGKGTTNNGTTCVRIKIKNQNCMKELEKNLNEWHKSALSLLFFRNIRHITICNEEIHWKSLGKGPVANSEYMALNGDKKNKFLLIRSEYEIFPDYALEEISEERMISEEDMKDYPPSRIEIVLGAKGHLFVVLPTQVETICLLPAMHLSSKIRRD